MELLFIVIATALNGLVALIGGLTLLITREKLDLLIKYLVAFSAGTMFSGSLFHLVSESEEKIGLNPTLYILTAGFLLFFVLERYLWYHHCHEGGCEVHPVSYLVLIGDSIHNFLDGMIIAASFMTDITLGLITAGLVIVHEVPQELGDFGVLVNSGIKPGRALLYNFLTQLTAVIGGISSYAAFSLIDFSNYLVPFAAGGFLYISASDLIPQIHRHSEKGRAIQYFLTFVAGIAIMIVFKFFGE